MAELRKRVGRRIRQLRRAAGLTQQELADRVGTYYKYLGYIERGQKNVTVATLERIARALGVEPYDLFVFRPDVGPADMVFHDRAFRQALRHADKRSRALAMDLMENILRWAQARKRGDVGGRRG